MKYTNPEKLTAESREAHFIKRLITKRYIIALVLIAGLLTANYALLQRTINQQKDDAYVINISGKQRMLSQKIAFLSNQMITTKDGIQKEQARQQLKLTVMEFRDSHEGLSKGSKSMQLPAPETIALQQMYFDKPVNLNRQVQTYIENVNNLLDEPVENLDSKNQYYQYIAASAQLLLESLNKVVKQYEKENTRKLANLKKLETVVYLSSLFVLLLEALIIFRPMVKRIGGVQKHLENVNRMKAEFIANMSHEIRTPMNGIFGSGELLQQSDLNDHQKKHTDNLLKSADNLMNLIDDVLDFSRIEAGKLTLEPIKFDLQSALEDVADLLSPKALEKRVDLMVRYNPGTPRFVVADPGRVRQVVTHLLENALKFTDEGYIMLSATVVEKEGRDFVLKISVEDTGVGIAKEKQKAIFEKFKQADMTSTKEHGGTGLGLAIAEQLVRLMKGKIGLNSTLGKGSDFWFSIPLKQAELNEKVITPKTLQGLKVLVVDDIAANRELLHEQLSTAGMTITLTSGGREALQQLRAAQQQGAAFDMVVSDYIMPSMDGEFLTTSIRKEAQIQKTPVIILTSAGESGFAKRFAEAGVTAYAAKPVRTGALLDILSHVWQHHQAGDIIKPITIHTSEASKTQAALANRVDPFKGARVLLVEDNRANRDFTKEMLENMGFYVTEAVNGQDSLNKLRNDTFDLILMDCQMPVMDGFEASRQITHLKASGQMPNTPIIALTANALAGDRERCLKAGMDDYISKPILLKKLESTVVKWLKDKIVEQPINVTPAETAAAPLTENKIFISPKVPVKNQSVAKPKQEIVASLPVSETPQPSIEATTTIADKLLPQQAPPPEVMQHTQQQEQIIETALDAVIIDMQAFNSVKSLMGAKFTKMMEYYIEDTQEYIQHLKDALAENNLEALITPAHSIKASSKQFGINELADIAGQVEDTARITQDNNSTVIPNTIGPLMPKLESLFNSTVPKLQNLMTA